MQTVSNIDSEIRLVTRLDQAVVELPIIGWRIGPKVAIPVLPVALPARYLIHDRRRGELFDPTNGSAPVRLESGELTDDAVRRALL